MSIDETIFYLKSMYSRHNEETSTFINDIPTEEPTIWKLFQNVSKMMKVRL